MDIDEQDMHAILFKNIYKKINGIPLQLRNMSNF